MANLQQFLSVFRSGNRPTRVTTKEREVLTPDEIVPQRFHFNSSHHVTGVPKERNHFAVDVNLAAHFERIVQIPLRTK